MKVKQKIVMTGATSKFGRLIVPLLEKKYDLTLITRNKANALNLLKTKSKIVELDLENATLSELEKVLFGATCVVNIAGLVDFTASKEKLTSSNVTTTRKLVKACELTKVKNFVHCSSIAIYKFSGSETVNENTTRNPRNDYGKSKLEGEEAVTQSKLNWICLRPGIVYGPHFTKEIETLVKLAKNKRLKLIGKGTNYLPLVYESDVAQAFATAVGLLENGKVKNESINLIGDEKTQKECFEILLKELKIDYELKSMPVLVALNVVKLLKTIGASKSLDPEILKVLSLDRKFENTKAKRVLKIKFTPVDEGIKKTLQAF